MLFSDWERCFVHYMPARATGSAEETTTWNVYWQAIRDLANELPERGVWATEEQMKWERKRDVETMGLSDESTDEKCEWTESKQSAERAAAVQQVWCMKRSAGGTSY